jgi:hypothetical protein
MFIMSNALHVSGVARPSSGALELYVQLLLLLYCNYSMSLQISITCGFVGIWVMSTATYTHKIQVFLWVTRSRSLG